MTEDESKSKLLDVFLEMKRNIKKFEEVVLFSPPSFLTLSSNNV